MFENSSTSSFGDNYTSTAILMFCSCIELPFPLEVQYNCHNGRTQFISSRSSVIEAVDDRRA